MQNIKTAAPEDVKLMQIRPECLLLINQYIEKVFVHITHLSVYVRGYFRRNNLGWQKHEGSLCLSCAFYISSYFAVTDQSFIERTEKIIL